MQIRSVQEIILGIASKVPLKHKNITPNNFKTKNHKIVMQTSFRKFLNNKYSTNQFEGLKFFCKNIQCVIRIPTCTFID